MTAQRITQPAWVRWPWFTLAIGGIAILVLLLSYRELPSRPFAADDYQWLLNVRDRSFAELLSTAFDPSQGHFYRPLVWLLIWIEYQLFGTQPAGYHWLSLGLHMLNAGLVAGLVLRLGGADWSGAIAFALVLLHPAPFEAVAWIAAQSELLAAVWLLLACHAWLFWHRVWWGALLATFCLGLALLTKESAAIGVLLLLLLDWLTPSVRAQRSWWRYMLPLLLLAGYAVLQIAAQRHNYLLETGGYSLGWHVVLNPLRSLGLIAAPLPGTEYADATWLPWAGAALLATLIGVGWVMSRKLPFRMRCVPLLALFLTLAPTAPFVSPPDSRYLYLPLIACALLIAAILSLVCYSVPMPRRALLGLQVGVVLAVIGFAWYASQELPVREGRFAAASGPGGSLWRLLTAECRADLPRRVVVVEPPLAAPHAEAIVMLACGNEVEPRVVGRAELADAIRQQTWVVAFPEGSAIVERKE
jgi:hypothetical protein